MTAVAAVLRLTDSGVSVIYTKLGYDDIVSYVALVFGKVVV